MSDLPKNRPLFFLRSDFALESGFVDYLRREVTQEEFARIKQKSGDAFSWKSFEAFNRKRASTPLPRYIMAGGFIRPGSTTPVPALGDGKTWFFPDPQCGLIADLLARAAIVAPPRKGEVSRILPTPISEPRKAWLRAEFAVLHDATTSIAEVWHWSEATEAILAWAKSQ